MHTANNSIEGTIMRLVGGKVCVGDRCTEGSMSKLSSWRAGSSCKWQCALRAERSFCRRCHGVGYSLCCSQPTWVDREGPCEASSPRSHGWHTGVKVQGAGCCATGGGAASAPTEQAGRITGEGSPGRDCETLLLASSSCW